MTAFDNPLPGREVDWLAVDLDGHIGLFSSAGFGPIPFSVEAQHEEVDRGIDKLDALPIVGAATNVPSGGDLSFWIEPARRGIFGYDWGPVATGPYARLATPSRPIAIHEIGVRDVAVAALLARLPLQFGDWPRSRLPTFRCRYSGKE